MTLKRDGFAYGLAFLALDACCFLLTAQLECVRLVFLELGVRVLYSPIVLLL